MITYIFHYKVELDTHEVIHKRVYSTEEEKAVEKIYKLYPNWIEIRLLNKFVWKRSK